MKYVNQLKYISIPAVFIIFIILFVSLGGCESRFRYTCQDPANWNSAECQKPRCTATKTCPEDLVGQEIVLSKIEAAEEPAPETNVEEQPKSCSDNCTE
jgi:hypothetical protein